MTEKVITERLSVNVGPDVARYLRHRAEEVRIKLGARPQYRIPIGPWIDAAVRATDGYKEWEEMEKNNDR